MLFEYAPSIFYTLHCASMLSNIVNQVKIINLYKNYAEIDQRLFN